MELEKKIREILFSIGKEIKIHTIGKDMIIDIDYEKYVGQLTSLLGASGGPKNDV
jgi:hypothetical protein